MPNPVIAIHRASVPDDPRTDEQLVLAYGDANPGLIQQYPDFGQQYQQLAAQRKADLTPTLGQEFVAGAARGTDSLLSTGQGAVALAAGAVGADPIKKYFLEKAQANEQSAAENPATVPDITDAKSVSDYAHYFAGKAGELAPNVAEAAVVSAGGAIAGGIAGTAAEPGGGTVVGAGGGFLAGLFEKQAIKSLIRRGVIKGLEDLGSAEGKTLLKNETLNLGRKYGTEIANTLNFWGQSSGGTYNTLTRNQNVDPDTAINVAIVGGLAQALPAQFLPSYITKKFFGEAAPSVNGYFARLASEAAKVVPGGMAAMDLQELASIASDKYADPKTRAQAFDLSTWNKDDRSRLINAAATGGLAGLIGSPIAAIPGGGKAEAVEKPAVEMKRYTGEQSQQDAARMDELAQKESSGTLSVDDKVLIDNFNPEQRNQFVLAKGKVARGTATTAEPPPAPPAATPPDASDLAAVTAKLKANPSPTTPLHGEVSDDDILAKLNPTPAPAAAPAGDEVQPPANPAAPSPALASARAASVEALSPDAQKTRANVATAAAAATETPPNAATPTAEKPLVVVDGIPIRMEHPEGTTRTGKSGEHQALMPAHYGEIEGTKGADGDPIDVYVGPKPENSKVFVIDQHNPETGKFDETKVMMGFDSQVEAQAAYDAAFSDGKGVLRRARVTETTKDGLKDWLEKGDTTKPFGASEAASGVVVHEKESARPGKVGSEQIDFDNTNLVAQESGAGKNRGKKGAGETTKFEPSYFEITPKELEDPAALGERLTSGARSSDQKQAYQNSRRLTAVQDNSTGKVFLLGTYREKTDGSIKLADPAKVGNEGKTANRNTRLADILAEKTPDGQQRYTPFASIRLNETKRSFVQEYANREAYDKDIGSDAKDRLATMADHAQSIEEMHNAGLTERGLNLPGNSTDEPTEEEPVSEAAAPEAKVDDGFTSAHADALWNVFGGEDGDTLSRERFEELFSSDLTKSRRGIEALGVAVRAAMEANGLTAEDAIAAVKDKLYANLERGYSGGKKAYAESAIQGFSAKPVEGASGGGDGPGKNLESAIRQRATERQQEGAEGNAVLNNPELLKFRMPDDIHKKSWIDLEGKQTQVNDHYHSAKDIIGLKDIDANEAYWKMMDGGYARVIETTSEIIFANPHNNFSSKQLSELKNQAIEKGKTLIQDGNRQKVLYDPNNKNFRQPSVQEQQQSSHHEALLDSIHKAAIEGGLNVQIIGQDLSRLSGEFAKRTGAAYDRASRTVAQVVATVIGKEDVITSLHEVGHDVFSKLAPEVRDRILRAIDSLSDRQLGVDISSDPRIRAADPAALGKPLVNEERLVEATALRLSDQGFSPRDAKGFAQVFVRALKDLFFRGAMAVQRALFGNDYTNPTLAQRFFENRVKGFLAGDFNRSSFIDMLGGGKPSEAKVASWHATGSPVFERLGADGTIDYAHTPDNSLDAARLNNLVFRKPDMPAEDQRTQIEIRSALFNHQLEMIAKAAQHPDILKAAEESKMSGDKYLLKTLGLADPFEMKQDLERGLSEAKSGIDYDHNKTIDGFESASNADKAALNAYINAQAMQSKASAAKRKAVDSFSNLGDQKTKAQEAYDKEKANYADWQHVTSKATQAMRSEGRKIFKAIAGESSKAGAIEQQLKALDPQGNIKQYAAAFQKLFTGDQLQGEHLFDVLDKLANDPKIDFNKPIDEIRQALAANPEYAKFVQDTNESRALTATVVAFAKTNQRVMANLELRRISNGADRVAIMKRLDDLKLQKDTFLTNLKELARTAKLEDRARRSYREALLEVRSINKRMENARAKIAAADILSPVIAKEHARLAEKLSIGTGTVFGDGSAYAVPLSKDASTKDLVKERAGDESPIGWQIHKLQLDSSRDVVSNPEDVEKHLRMMADFLNEREARAAAGDTNALDTGYQGVKNAFEEIAANKNFRLNITPAERFMAGIGVLGPGQKVEDAFGTQSARDIGQMVRQEADEQQRMQPHAERIWRQNEQLEDQLLKLFRAKLNDKRRYLRDNFLNPAKKTMQAQTELAERHAGNPTGLKAAIYNRVMDMLLNNEATLPYVRGQEEAWRTHLQNLLEFQHDANKYFESQVRGEGDRAQTVLGRTVASGHGVADERLKAVNPATGKLESAVRRAVPVGPYTFAQKMTQGFRTMVNALRGSGWVVSDAEGKAKSLAADDFTKIAEAYKSGGKDAADKIVQKFFSNSQHGDQVRNAFFRSLAEMDTESPFEAPTKEDGITTFPADIAKVQEAYKQAGNDPVAFFELLHQMHGGEGDVGDYVQKGMSRLSELAMEAHRILDKYEPTGTDSRVSVRSMSADYALNARRIDHLPGQWFDYHSLDSSDTHNITKRIAAQNAFGPNGERIGKAFDTLKNEVTQAQYKLSQARAEVLRQNPTADTKTLDKLLSSKLGADEYKRLKTFNDRARFVEQSVKDLVSYHRRDYSPDGTLSFMTRLAHTIGGLMINQPSSAISLLSQLTDINLRYGASKSVVGSSIRSIGSAGNELAGSLAQAVGLQIFNGGEEAQRYRDLGLNEPATIRTFRDTFGRLENEGTLSHGLRVFQDVLGTPVNPLGEKAQHVPFKPFKPFDTMGAVVDQKITEAVWRLASQHLSLGQEFYRSNLDKLNDPKFKLTADVLGLKGAQKDSFLRLTSDMERWNLNYDDMVRSGMQRGDKTVFTNQEAARLYSMAVSEIALRGSLANFSAAWTNNSILRLAAPLMAWSFRRMTQVFSLPLNAEGKRDIASFARGIAGLSLAAGGGLAVSALMDQYYQKLVGKQRNLRPVLDAASPGQAALGVMEDLSRIGTFGILGEGINSVLGLGQGGDNRTLSVDQRVLAVSALQSVMQAANSWINQDFNADYSHVIRPFIGAVGGGGLIQYMQLANNALGLDNVEARVTARINAQNYLRVVGRELGMDLQTSAGGYGTPTPITPYLTAMELAAYKNSPGDFRLAYANAVRAAKEQGQADPVEYVKRTFSSRNPLRTVFKTPPTQYEYERLLANMPGSGMQDVHQAVNLFNQYSESIGAKPFEGKVAKAKPIHFGLEDFRQKAANALQ